ncbi:MAG: hypothetical protein JSU09_16570 [Bacteroidetes bacterium]|nr:hypothetical protein [Bacteroidota bacterium]
MKKTFMLVCLVAGIVVITRAQSTTNESPKKKTMFGLEADVVPYFLGGYHGSAVVGYNQWRFRGVFVGLTTPNSLLDDGFKDNKIKVGAIIVDYFFQPNWKKLFISTGVEYLGGNLSHENVGTTSDYNSILWTAGAGYVWKFYKNFYLAPHVAFTLRVSGDSKVSVGSFTQSLPSFQPEGGLRVGWHF